MAHQSGTTTGRTRAALETSKALATLAATDAALAQGELSDQQADAVCGAAGSSGTDPETESRLLEMARTKDLRELRDAAARERSRAEDESARAKRLHRQRFLRTWKGADGSWNLLVRNTPEAGAEVEAALAPLRESIFLLARRAGRHESAEAYGADALAELVRGAVGAEDVLRGGGRRAGAGATGSGTSGNETAATEASPAGTSGVDVAGADMGGANETGADVGGTDVAGTDVAGAEVMKASATGTPGTVVDETDSEAPDADPGPRVPRSRRPDTKFIVLIDYEALKRGWARPTRPARSPAWIRSRWLRSAR